MPEGNAKADTSKDKKEDKQQEQQPEKDESKQEKDSSKEQEKDSDGTPRDKQKEFFKEELKRLEKSLQEDASKISKPPPKPYTPFIWTSLEPYYNTYTVKYLVDSPETQDQGYNTRSTAIGLCDPWVNLKMDTLPEIDPKLATPRSGESKGRDDKKKETGQEDNSSQKKKPQSQSQSQADKDKKKKSQDRPAKVGSTRLPKYPVVNLETKEFATKKLNYRDVPVMRQTLHDKYSPDAPERVDQDYTRTKQDFYRMELDKMEDVHPQSRENMRQTYFAYLQNTPGSKKAVNECVKSLKVK